MLRGRAWSVRGAGRQGEGDGREHGGGHQDPFEILISKTLFPFFHFSSKPCEKKSLILYNKYYNKIIESAPKGVQQANLHIMNMYLRRDRRMDGRTN